MENKEKKHHHFVPQVYLRKFAHSREEKGNKEHYFVSTLNKIDNNEIIKTNVANICFKTRLYTLESSEKGKRESIENFYADTLEDEYNKLYEIVTNDNIVDITLGERELILTTIINLHLRNLFWLEALNNFWTTLITKFDHPTQPNVYTEEGHILFPFENHSVDEIISFSKTENRTAFIDEHLRLTVNLVTSHSNDLILVETNKDKVGFITSDRPVICKDIASSFRLPINKDYYISIMPNSENIAYNIKSILRNYPFTNTRLYNMMQYENAERLVIGFDINGKNGQIDHPIAN